MADLVVVVGMLAFFAICVGFVWACDRIIGPDPEQSADEPEVSERQAAAR
jgi:hypothetical protein